MIQKTQVFTGDPIYPDNLRLTRIMVEVADYLKEESRLLKPNGQAHNISSDIIESIFGAYKDRKSPNKLYGVTPFVLFIPVHAQIIGMHDKSSIDLKHMMTTVKLKDLDHWKDQNLLKNWVTERSKILKKRAEKFNVKLYTLINIPRFTPPSICQSVSSCETCNF